MMVTGHCSNPMRILHIQGDTGTSGGIANYISTLVKNALPGQTFVVTASENDPIAFEGMFPGAKPAWIPFTYSMRSAAAYRRTLRSVIASARPHVIHTHALRTAMQVSRVACEMGVPVVYTNHGLRYRQKAGQLQRLLFARMESVVMRRVARTVCIREHDLRIARRMMRSDIDRLTLVETRLDVPVRARTDAVRRPLSVVGCGSLIPVKGPERFLEWVTVLRDGGQSVLATWLGDGELRRTIEQDISSGQLPVVLRGHVGKEELFDALAQADVMFLSSQFETFPLAVLEGYAMGVPVISSPFEGVDDFVEHGRTGAVLGRKGAETIGAALNLLLRDDKVSATRNACRDRFQARHANPALMVASYGRLYDAVSQKKQ